MVIKVVPQVVCMLDNKRKILMLLKVLELMLKKNILLLI